MIPILKGMAMNPFKLFIVFIFVASCTKYASLDKEAVSLQIKNVSMEISHLDEIEWRIGKNKEAEVSQSITFIVDLPKLKQSDLDFLIEQKDVDAWILRLIAVKRNQTQDLGSLYALFRPRRVSRGAQNITGSVTFKIFYAAAYASQRFRMFKCPAFGHNKKISSMDIKGENEEFTLAVNQVITYNEKSNLVELTPTAFNGGHSLTGNYFVEIAPYNSQKKQIYSTFERIPMYVSVSEEASVEIKSCEGVHPEYE